MLQKQIVSLPRVTVNISDFTSPIKRLRVVNQTLQKAETVYGLALRNTLTTTQTLPQSERMEKDIAHCKRYANTALVYVIHAYTRTHTDILKSFQTSSLRKLSGITVQISNKVGLKPKIVRKKLKLFHTGKGEKNPSVFLREKMTKQ